MATSTNSTSRCALRKENEAPNTRAWPYTSAAEKKRDYSIRKLHMGHRHAVRDGDGGNGGVSCCAANTWRQKKEREQRTR
jgi:hypothetical protein